MASDTKGRFEMLWDCPGCGTEKLLGLTHRHCPNCGAPQDPTRRYFPKEGEEIAVGDHPYQGADVACPGCDTPNAAKAQFCVSCGGGLEGAKAVAQRGEQAKGKAGFSEDTARAAAEEREANRQKERQAQMAAHAQSSGAPPPPKEGGGKGGLFGMLGAGVVVVGLILIGLCGAFFFWSKDAALEVTAQTWERTIEVETLTPTKDSAWKESVPAGAYDLSCSPAEKSKQRIADGQDCTDKRRDKGDGSFEVVQDCKTRYREEPVMADKCSYTVDTWKVSKTEKALGAVTTPATWPAVSLSNPGTCVGCQREGARKETYTVALVDQEKAEHSCDLPEDRWRAMAVGSKWKATVGVMSGALNCAQLQPQ